MKCHMKTNLPTKIVKILLIKIQVFFHIRLIFLIIMTIRKKNKTSFIHQTAINFGNLLYMNWLNNQLMKIINLKCLIQYNKLLIKKFKEYFIFKLLNNQIMNQIGKLYLVLI